ncbi:hypothetical protein Syun_006440 [Stephania yunnanensis]|uniref:Uncharacterized protein n=1 Tax=Stephania yunnanensis TaxID=152371 RepID=A0AAP0KY94_9MAGN
MATAPSLHLLLLRPPNSPQSLSPLKNQLSFSIATAKSISFISPRPRRHSRFAPVVVAAQSTVLRVLQTAWRFGKDGIEAGTRLVPDSVPRPIARISVAGVAVLVSLFLLKSILSTAFFIFTIVGLVFFSFLTGNCYEGSHESVCDSETQDTLEEARRIMEKYK